MPVPIVFEQPTISMLAKSIDPLGADGEDEPEPEIVPVTRESYRRLIVAE
jgi:hypothetical protein